MHYIKFDFRHAFYNIDIHPKSKYITSFKYEKEYYYFNKLPFGISIAPYVAQKFLNSIIKIIKKLTPFTWGHIDDIGHHSEHALFLFGLHLKSLFKKINWVINEKKSVLIPVTRIKFLGSYWGPTQVKRSKQTTIKCQF